jgi:hypothetical protein
MAPPSGFTFAGIEAEFVDHRQRLRGEGFVQFDPVEVVLPHAGLASAPSESPRSADTHDSGGTPATA